MRTKIIVGLVGLGLIILLVLFVSGTLSSLFTSKQEARTAKGQAGAAIQSGAEATNTIGNVMKADADIDTAIKGGTDEVRSRPAGHSNDAAVRAACRLRINFDRERCARLRRADTVNAAGGSSRR